MVENRLALALESTHEEAKGKRRSPSKEWTVSVYLGPERKDRVARLQREWNLSASATIRLLLDYSLAAVDKGKLAPEIETVTKAKAPKP